MKARPHALFRGVAALAAAALGAPPTAAQTSAGQLAFGHQYAAEALTATGGLLPEPDADVVYISPPPSAAAPFNPLRRAYAARDALPPTSFGGVFAEPDTPIEAREAGTAFDGDAEHDWVSAARATGEVVRFRYNATAVAAALAAYARALMVPDPATPDQLHWTLQSAEHPGSRYYSCTGDWVAGKICLRRTTTSATSSSTTRSRTATKSSTARSRTTSTRTVSSSSRTRTVSSSSRTRTVSSTSGTTTRSSSTSRTLTATSTTSLTSRRSSTSNNTSIRTSTGRTSTRSPSTSSGRAPTATQPAASSKASTKSRTRTSLTLPAAARIGLLADANPAPAKRYIFGADDRVRIPPERRNERRYRVVGVVGDHCTGTIVGPRHVLTAGHCVHSGKDGDYIRNLDFTPSHDDDGVPASPHGVLRWHAVHARPGWTERGDFAYDYALIELEEDTGLGWFNYGWNDGIDSGWTMNLNGYPGDKWKRLYYSGGPVIAAHEQSFNYRFDMVKGNSGSGVYAWNPRGTKRVIYGVNSAQMWLRGDERWANQSYVTGHTDPSYNRAVRINAPRFAMLCAWIDDFDAIGC